MKNPIAVLLKPPATDNRAGATLTEVLMAILIMGIGMIGVISLFPAAVLRSVQAHALTTSANLRYNAEAAIAIYPQLLANPERNLGNPTFHNQPDAVFMVDPLGLFNHGIADGTRLGGAGTQTMMRFSAGFTSLPAIEEVFSCADKWTVQYEAVPTGGNVDVNASPQTFTLNGLTQQQVYIGPGLAPTRLVIFNRAGDRCQVRDVDSTLTANTSPLGNTVAWSAALPASFCAATFPAADIGKVRVEQRELTFTWLMTAKRQASTSGNTTYAAHVAVFHKRSYSPTDLTVFGNGAGLVFTKGQTTANIVVGPGTSPFLKRGGYVLDASTNSGIWYRIQDFVEGAGVATITLESPAVANSSAAVFMKGVVAVFTINNTSIDQVPFGYDEH